jgi:hypothetical protein
VQQPLGFRDDGCGMVVIECAVSDRNWSAIRKFFECLSAYDEITSEDVFSAEVDHLLITHVDSDVLRKGNPGRLQFAMND